MSVVADSGDDISPHPPPVVPIEPTQPWLHRGLDLIASLLFVGALCTGVAAILTGWVGLTIVMGDSMEPTIESGDLVLTRPRPSYSIGEVVVFTVPLGQPSEGARVIHRISGGTMSGFETMGDNRDGADIWTPAAHDIVGAHQLTVPAAGALLLKLRSPLIVGLIIAAAAFRLTLMTDVSRLLAVGRKRSEPEELCSPGQRRACRGSTLSRSI